MEKFSQLEIDKKTFSHCIEYFNALKNNTDSSLIDNIIQKTELESHLQKCQKLGDKCEESSWISKNAKPFRTYINSLKTIALFCFVDSQIYFREELNYKVFCQVVKIWNERKQKIIDSIRIDS